MHFQIKNDLSRFEWLLLQGKEDFDKANKNLNKICQDATGYLKLLINWLVDLSKTWMLHGKNPINCININTIVDQKWPIICVCTTSSKLQQDSQVRY